MEEEAEDLSQAIVLHEDKQYYSFRTMRWRKREDLSQAIVLHEDKQYYSFRMMRWRKRQKI